MHSKSHSGEEKKKDTPDRNVLTSQGIGRQRNPNKAYARVMSAPASMTPADIMALQRTVGNHAVQRMIAEGGLHANREAAAAGNAPAAPVAEEKETEQTAITEPIEVPAEEKETASEQLLVVPEEFTPAEFAALPDESSTEVARVDSGEEHTEEPEERTAVTAPQVAFHDLGRTGTVRFGAAEAPDKYRPRSFTAGGQTGTVAWGGGGGAGARGNQAAGSIQSQTAPVFEATPVAAGVSTATVQAGTGTLSVTRSWVGIASGNQGTGWFVTPAAATRINAHEILHVMSSRTHYNTHLAPLLVRARDRRIGATQAAAIAALTAYVNWPASVTAFQNADTADNAPGGTVDTNDLNSGTYPVNSGPGTVAGVAYANRLRLPTEPDPV